MLRNATQFVQELYVGLRFLGKRTELEIKTLHV